MSLPNRIFYEATDSPICCQKYRQQSNSGNTWQFLSNRLPSVRKAHKDYFKATKNYSSLTGAIGAAVTAFDMLYGLLILAFGIIVIRWFWKWFYNKSALSVFISMLFTLLMLYCLILAEATIFLLP